MSYKLPIYTDEELAQAGSYPPLENGRFRFRVIECQQALSVNNNPQEQLVFEVHHKPNQTKKCWHNFTFKEITSASSPKDIETAKWLVANAKRFLVCVGIEYTPDAFRRVMNLEGIGDFFVKEYKAKDGNMKEKFVVPNEGFISPDDLNKPGASAPASTPTATKPQDFDDDVPF